MITATDLELRAGSRILLSGANLRIQPGDRIGLVGRNGAGKTTSLRVLAGEGEPYAGAVTRNGELGYLPQDPREGDLSRHREGPRAVRARPRPAAARHGEGPVGDVRAGRRQGAGQPPCASYGRLEERFSALGGYAAESEAARICSNLGLPDRVLDQQLQTLSGGQRRRVELARILFAASEAGVGAKSSTILLLDEPTNHLDADSITWLRGFLKSHDGGLVVISHDVELLDDVVNKVWFLDAMRGEVDLYNLGWKKYLEARATDEKRRRRERANAEKKAGALMTQAAKMGAKATKAVAAQNMAKRAEKLLAGLDDVRQNDKVAKIRFPEPAPCGKTPLTAEGLSKSYGSLEIFTGVDLAIDKGSRVVVLGLQRRRQDDAAAAARRQRAADAGEVVAGHGLQHRLLRAGARDARPRRVGVGEHPARRAGHAGAAAAVVARHVPVHRRAARPARGHVVRWREDPARAGGSGVVQRGERAAARRADQQPRPGQPRAGARRAAAATRARSCS